jgi:hypothetical protein
LIVASNLAFSHGHKKRQGYGDPALVFDNEVGYILLNLLTPRRHAMPDPNRMMDQDMGAGADEPSRTPSSFTEG